MKIFFHKYTHERKYFFLFFLLSGFSASMPAQQESINTLVELEGHFSTLLYRLDTETDEFVEHWNSTATHCNEVSSPFFGNLKSPCRSVRAALRRGTIPDYQKQCIKQGADIFSKFRGSVISENQSRYEKSLISFEQSLFDICEFDKYLTENAAFAELKARALVAMPVDFDSFGPMDSMAWWNPRQDQSNSGTIMPGSPGSLPAILGGQ